MVSESLLCGLRSRPGAQPIGLCLGTSDINFTSLWKGIETSDYNFEQAYWGSYDTGHPELSEPYTQYLAGYEPVAEWYAENVFGLSGAAYPHNQWVNENENPAASTLPRNGMFAYPPYSLALGLGGWILQDVWNSYLYDPNAGYLSTTVYPLMKQAAIFYAGALNACPKAAGGQAIYGPSFVEEIGSYGVDDVTSDIGFTQLTLQAAIQAANTLGVDGNLVTQWQQALALLPSYPTAASGSETVITDCLGGSASTAYNVAVPVLPVYPAGVVNWFSPAAEQAEFLNTIETVNWGTVNSVVMMAGAYARLAPAQTAYNFISNVFSQYQQANGILIVNGTQSANFTEGFAASGVISEMLLQSVGGIARFFPAMPSSQNASFSNLGAQGGFQVSASQQNGTIGPISVTATQAAAFSFLSPWQTPAVTIDGQAVTLVNAGGGVYTIPASAWSPASGTAGMQAVIAPSPEMAISLTDSGHWQQGGSGSFSITVSNAGAGATNGTVTVVDTLPNGLAPTAADGGTLSGWTLSADGQTITATRSDVLASGAAYPALTLAADVDLPAGSWPPRPIRRLASGGGEVNTANDTASDTIAVAVADLTVSLSDSGNLRQGMAGSFTITVSNRGFWATSGTVNVVDTLPAAFAPTAADSGTGNGWTLATSGQTITATRSDELTAAASYPALSLAINVAPNPPASLSDTVTVSGGSEVDVANDTASDSPPIAPMPDLAVALSDSNTLPVGTSGIFTVSVSNVGFAATSGTVTVVDTLPAGLASTAADSGTGNGWTLSTSGQMITATRSDALAVGASYPGLVVAVVETSRAPPV